MKVDLDDLRIPAEPRPRVRSRSRPLLFLLALLLLPLGFAAGWFVREGSPTLFGGAVRVRTVAVRAERGTPGEAPRHAGDFSEGGWIEVPSYDPIVVSALIPGRVDELFVLEGAKVTKGELVARLYTKDLEEDLKVASAQVDAAKAALALLEKGYREEDVEKARHEVEDRKAARDLAEKVAARTRELVPAGAASKEERERDEAAAREAAAQLASAKAELKRLTAGYRPEDIDKARADLAKAEASRDLAKLRLSHAEIRAPVAGVVLERFVTPGTSLTAADRRVVSIYDPGDLQARVDVRQENEERVRVGQDVQITTEAEPNRVYHGKVIRMQPLADLKKNTVQAKVKIADPGPGLHPEMICRARFLAPAARTADKASSGTAETILTVPESAVRTQGEREFVYVVEGGAARRREIRTGGLREGRIVVSEGLTAGERIVLSPDGLADGTPVKEVAQ